MTLPVRFHPVAQSCFIQPEFPGNISDRPRSLYHHPGGFLLELRREVTAFLPCHSIPSFPVKILLDPVRKARGTPREYCPQAWAAFVRYQRSAAGFGKI